MSDNEIQTFMTNMGFSLINPRNWTYATSNIYLSDMHDENVIKSDKGTVFVVDCDIRINTPQLKANGIRSLTTEITDRQSQQASDYSQQPEGEDWPLPLQQEAEDEEEEA